MCTACHIAARSCAKQQAVKHARSISQRRATRVEDDLDCTRAPKWSTVGWVRRREAVGHVGQTRTRAEQPFLHTSIHALYRTPSGPLEATNECVRTAT